MAFALDRSDLPHAADNTEVNARAFGSDFGGSGGVWSTNALTGQVKVTSDQYDFLLALGNHQMWDSSRSVSTAVEVSVRLRSIGANCSLGVVCALANDNNFYMFRYQKNTNGLQLWKRVGGTFTQLGSSVVFSTGANDVLKLVFDPVAHTLAGYVNGVLKIGPQATTGNDFTSGYCGVHWSLNTAETMRAADFSVAPTGTPATPLGFVFAGESNSGGYALNTTPDPLSAADLEMKPQVQILDNTGLVQLLDVQVGVNNLVDHSGLSANATHGWELELANKTAAAFFASNPQVYLVKTGQGGSKVADWASPPDSNGWWAKFAARMAAAATYAPSGISWTIFMSIGLNDRNASVTAADFETGLRAYIAQIRAVSGLGTAKLVMTQFQSQTAAGFANMDAYDAKIATIAGDTANCYAVASTGCSMRDTAHWDSAGIATMCDRMLDAAFPAPGGGGSGGSASSMASSAMAQDSFEDSMAQSAFEPV